MPSTVLHPTTATEQSHAQSPLPPLLHTPLGLAIIEIQGTLNLPASLTEPSPSAEHAAQDATTQVGRLDFPLLAGDTPQAAAADAGPWMKKVHLYVGQNQRLVGEVRPLKKPLGVVRRRQRLADGSTDTPMHGTVELGADELEIVDVVRWKLFFGGRPEFV